MKPLAMSLQLVLDERKRLSAEIEIVWEDGSTTAKRIPANERFTIHFDDEEPKVSIRPPGGT